MKNRKLLILILCLPVLVSLPYVTHAQGIKITSGATMKTTGATYIIIHDGSFVNNGTFTAGTGNTVTMNGTSVRTITDAAKTTFDKLTIDNSGGISMLSDVDVNNTFTLTNGNLSVGAYTLGIKGTISKTSGFLAVTSSSMLSFGGTSAITIPNNLFSSTPSINNLTINRSGGVTLGNQNMTVNGSLGLTSGTFSLAANTLTIAGSSPARTSGNIDAGNASATLAFTNTSAIILPASVFTGNVNNLTINGTGGVTASSDFTVAGILHLESANPSSTKGSLDMWDGSVMKTLTMDANSTTVGIGDVTGIVKRTSFAMSTQYTFGNEFTKITFTVGPLPTSVSFKIILTSSEPAWMTMTEGIWRYYDITQTGSDPATRLALNLHYLNAELYGALENDLVFFDYHVGTTQDVDNHGHSNRNTTENWVGLANLGLTFVAATAFDQKYWTLGSDKTGNIHTWIGGSPSGQTDWTLPGNWNGGVPVNVSDHVIIPDVTYDPLLPGAGANIWSIFIEYGGILNATTGSPTLTINGDAGAWENMGTFNAGTSTVVFTNAEATMADLTNFYNATIANGAGLTPGTDNIMRISGTMTNNGTFSAASLHNDIEYNGTDQSVINPNGPVPGYHCLILSGSGTKTMPGSALYILQDFMMSGSASATPAYPIIVTGATTLCGTSMLTLGAANILSDTSAITLDGGTLKTGATTGYSDTVGTLNLSDNSTMSLGTGAHSLTFAASNEISWTPGKILTITGWTGNWNGTTGTAGKIFSGSSTSGLNAGQLAQISFNSGSAYYPAAILSDGEVVPTGNFIRTGTIAGSPFCAGTSGISVPFTYSLTTNFTGATFTAQLSDASGSFASPVTLQNVAYDGSGSQGVSITIPSGTASGIGYRIRVVSDSPAVTGSYYGELTIDPLPAIGLTVGGSGSVCSGTGTNITVAASVSGTDYQLRNDNANESIGTPVTGTGGSINLPTGNLTSSTTFNILAILGSCTAGLTGTATVSVDPLPAISLTVGGTGTICSGTGTSVTVASSVSGTSYQLRNDDGDANIGTPVPGTGGTINLPTGNMTSAATFNVLATLGSCSAELTGKATISVNPSDISLAVGGTGEICSGTGTGITVSNSVISTSYQLRNDSASELVGDAVEGTGGTINLPSGNLTSSTTFNVLATEGSCSAELTNKATVTVNPLPAIGLAVDGVIDICSGESTNITVAASIIGTSYQLRNDNANELVGGPVTGTGGLIDLPTGNLAGTTTFNILATIVSTDCSAELTGKATVTVNPLPDAALAVGGTDYVCSGIGADVTVALSEIGVNYQLRNDDADVNVGSVVAGDGGTINLPTGDLTAATTFNVLATLGSCSVELTGKATVIVSALPDITLAVGGTGSVCSGTGTNVTVELSISGVNYELRNDFDDSPVGLLVAGTGGTIDLPTGDLVSTTTFNVLATNSSSDCSAELTGKATITVNARKKISGIFTYYNTPNTLLTGTDIIVQIYKTTDVGHSIQLGKDTTNASGFYEFTDLCPDCDYDLVAVSTHTAEGSVNITDAAQVNYFGTNPYLIEKVRFHAGDVGTAGTPSDLTIQATDAGRIQQNFVYGTAFDNSWTFWKTGDAINSTTTAESYPPVTLVVGSDLTADMYGLCTGDFNRSFNPAFTKSASATLDLIYAGNRQAGKNQEFDLPLHMVNSSQVGAVSLILNFPDEMVEIKDVLMDGAGGQLDWAVKGNELRIGWNSSVPLFLLVASELLTLKLKTTDAFTEGNFIRLTLASDPLNELADEFYNVIVDAVLSVDIIDASKVGLEEPASENGFLLGNYPNPFSNYTMITYSLPFEGKVTLEINSIIGSKVATLVSETQPAGKHSVKFATYGLPTGVYTATLRLKSSDNELIRNIKLVNNK